MKVELKNIKHMPSLSEETNAYTATLYVDGRKIGTVKNSGQGGPDEFHGDRDAHAELSAYLQTLPEIDYGSFKSRPDVESVCGELLEEHLITKELKRKLRTHVLYSENGAIYQTPKKQKSRTFTDAEMIPVLRERHPNADFLNSLLFDEALAIFKANAS